MEKSGTDGRMEVHAHRNEQNKKGTFLWIYIHYRTTGVIGARGLQIDSGYGVHACNYGYTPEGL